MVRKVSKQPMQRFIVGNREVRGPCPESKGNKRGKDEMDVSVGVDKLTKDPNKKSRNFRGCFICRGPHYAQDCPLMLQVSSIKIEGNIGPVSYTHLTLPTKRIV